MALPSNQGDLRGKKILLGICGSIAAYKSVFLLRLLVKAGAKVRVVPTESSLAFVGKATWSTLSGHEAYDSIHDDGAWHNHVDLGLWADLMVIAPATAQTLAKMAGGFADNLLTATYLSARCPVWVIPAMDLDMWQHPATRFNIENLNGFNVRVIPPEFGPLASGLTGYGRLPEPEHLFELIVEFLLPSKVLAGKKILLTGGPTVEAIDPVRFISNHSSGKMSVALADSLARAGAQVVFVHGPVSGQTLNTGIQTVSALSAKEMMEACQQHFADADIAIFAAAVSDYRPEKPSIQKIKKHDDRLELTLVRNPDIAAAFGKIKSPHQISIGFALESESGLDQALLKLKSKNFDAIVLNSLQDEGAGFGTDTNRVTLITAHRDPEAWPLMSKTEVANRIVNFISNMLMDKAVD